MIRTENSRAPSYFSRFFEEQLQHDDGSGTLRTLYIDRDPATFKDICRHLQGEAQRPEEEFIRNQILINVQDIMCSLETVLILSGYMQMRNSTAVCQVGRERN